MAWQTGTSPALFKTRNRVTEVHIDGLALLKLVKHCRDSLPQMVAGSLLGLDEGKTLEITHCFPVPAPRAEVDEYEGQPEGVSPIEGGDMEGEEYQMEMMKMLREVNVDNNCVGWYKSIYFGSFCQTTLVETQFSYQENLSENSVVVLYDPVQSLRSTTTIKAYRLSDEFVDAYRAKSTGFVPPSDVLIELPLKIRNPGLITAFLYDVKQEGLLKAGPRYSDRLDNPAAPLERYLEHMCSWVDELLDENTKFQYYLRSIDRQGKDAQRWGSKRDDDDPTAQSWKNTTPPTRLDSLLIANQINEYANHIQLHSKASLSKLYLTTSLTKAAAPAGPSAATSSVPPE
ncbi:hypothetical protein CTAYLR_010726 [Chrysophaeum taylorii]|uniref:Eukaryotic translation initiation factor 3 subunit H n=1 Tax=Chrysophaeum taylorii TaxID=2483200 RepID=A0AAD7UI19_9STRA|nr:hypothetical protein CTAYLR_010726 [Chrysophaeum taylorii]